MGTSSIPFVGYVRRFVVASHLQGDRVFAARQLVRMTLAVKV